jgi:magnesium transporter
MTIAFPRGQSLKDATWIDLLSPTPEEIVEVQQSCGVRVPTEAEVSEIEASSRLKVEGESLYMTAPLISGTQEEGWETAPTGFLLCPRVCITVRFNPIATFDSVAGDLAGKPWLPPAEVMIRLLEEVVDRAADHLELTAIELNAASKAIFRNPRGKSSVRAIQSDALRSLMSKIGQASDHMSHARYTLLCIVRVAQFVTDRADWIRDEDKDRLSAIRHDIASLEQFEENQLNRVQLLQDAAQAFINIQQNDVVKVLTIASVVGIPPVLVVGVYGMNFQAMPELHWKFGYPYAIVLTIVSAVIPLIWFKIKRWM